MIKTIKMLMYNTSECKYKRWNSKI